MRVKNLIEEIDVPEGTAVEVAGALITVTKGKAMNKRIFNEPRIKIKKQGNKIILEAENATKKEKMLLGTVVSHINNMIKGVTEPFVYKLKVCSGHFPINITISGGQFIVKNFVGEKVPRILEFEKEVDVKIEGNDITVISQDKEKAGKTAGAIELLCRRPGFDTRVFQQGIYIIEKAGKPIA